MNKRKVVIRVINLIVIFAVATLVLAPAFKLSSYDIGYDVSLKLYDLGIFTNYTYGMSEDYLRKYLSQPTTELTHSLSFLQIIGVRDAQGLPLDVTDNTYALLYLRNIPSEIISSLQQSVALEETSAVSSVDAYRTAMLLLGYTEDDFGTADDDVLAYAQSIHFGFSFDVRKKASITNGELAQILYETLFVRVKPEDAAFYRVRARNDDEFQAGMYTLGMYDDMPDLIPLFNHGIYQAGSFYGFLGENSDEMKPKNEWTASYLCVLQSDITSYYNSLLSNGWALEGEYELEHRLDSDNLVMSTLYLFYRTASLDWNGSQIQSEIYCTMRYYPDMDLLELNVLV